MPIPLFSAKSRRRCQIPGLACPPRTDPLLLCLMALAHAGASASNDLEPRDLFPTWSCIQSWRYHHTNDIGMSCPSWQWHRTGSRWSPVRTLPVAPLWCDLEFVPNSRGNKSCGEPSPYWHISLTLVLLSQQAWYCLPLAKKESFAGRGLKMIIFICCSKIDCWQ